MVVSTTGPGSAHWALSYFILSRSPEGLGGVRTQVDGPPWYHRPHQPKDRGPRTLRHKGGRLKCDVRDLPLILGR